MPEGYDSRTTYNMAKAFKKGHSDEDSLLRSTLINTALAVEIKLIHDDRAKSTGGTKEVSLKEGK